MGSKKKKQERIAQAEKFSIASLFIISGISLGIFGESFIKQIHKKNAVQAASQITITTEPAQLQPPTNSVVPVVMETMAPTETTTDQTTPTQEIYIPAPDQLNLAHYFPEEATIEEQEEVLNSYAGKVFKELSVKEGEWLSDLYELVDVKPVKMAKRLGKSTSSVMGKYNPKDEAHNINNQSTWTINKWNKVNVSFTNGNKERLTNPSNVKEILAMASVYTYHHDMMDAETFSAYARQLWDSSHQYSLGMSGVYYCKGCLDKADEEIAREEAMQELGLTVESGLGELLEINSGFMATEDSSSEADSSENHTLADASLADHSSGSGSADTGTGDTAAGDVSQSSSIPVTPAETVSATEAAAPQTTQAIPPEAAATAQTSLEISSEIAAKGAETESSGTRVINRSAQGSAKKTEAQSVSDHSDASELTESAAVSAIDSANPEPDLLDGAVTEASPSNAPSAEQPTQKAPEAKKKTQIASCPGHVDLNIYVKVLGLTEKNGLIAKDKIGNNKDNMQEYQWNGWNQESISYAKSIVERDWFSEYGLSLSAISLSSPLTAAEIEAYLQELPDDISDTRREVIRTALSSVGRIPYYWGGKPSSAGYDRNNFGRLVLPDDKGRILRGLDCSGWVNWVYWSSTGKPLKGESTSSLILCGSKIKRSDLQPGDIIIRTGTSAHVVMFLSWAPGGQMNVIHQSGVPINNVTVKTMNAPWPYYRKLVD